MGRYSFRDTVEDCLSIGIPWLSKHGYLCGFMSGGIEWKRQGEVTATIDIQVSVVGGWEGKHVRFQYIQTDSQTREKTEFDYKADLTTTPCNYGGVRYWFVCPLIVNGRPCGRRVANLYLPPGGKYFGCRHCYDLTYRSCKEHDKRVDRLRRLPPQELLRLASSDNIRLALLAIDAGMKNLERL